MGPKSKSKGVKCSSCNLKIDATEPAVEAMKKKYHKNCFVCVNCQNNIAGNFHQVGEKPWCDSCFVEKQAPRCSHCQKPIIGTSLKTEDGRVIHEECLKNLTQGICEACKMGIAFTDPVVEALGNTFHKHCFRCVNCGGDVPSQFHAENGRPFCENCHTKKLIQRSPVCGECNQAIIRGVRVEVLSRFFHESCFPKAGWGNCDSCHSKVLFTEPCINVPVLNCYWHLGCLSCRSCNENIRSAFYLQSDRPCCSSCYLGHVAPKCYSCARPIAENQVKAMKQFWHPECFVCASCKDILCNYGNEFFNVGGRPLCKHDVEAQGIKIAN